MYYCWLSFRFAAYLIHLFQVSVQLALSSKLYSINKICSPYDPIY